jgi:hypothetical protein
MGRTDVPTALNIYSVSPGERPILVREAVQVIENVIFVDHEVDDPFALVVAGSEGRAYEIGAPLFFPTSVEQRRSPGATPRLRVLLMNLLDPSPVDGRSVTGAFVVLAKWYAAHSVVRRLWAFNESRHMRVIVKLEPTRDGDDIYPVWLANGHEWAHELQLRLGGPVHFEAIDEPSLAGFGAGVDSVLVAELSWRDASMPSFNPDDDVEPELAAVTQHAAPTG